MQGEREKDMTTYDMEFDFYSDEPPKYFSRKSDKFDGYDSMETEQQKEQAAG